MKVTKEFKFDMSHMLAGHPGLCKNLHGHTYKLEVTVEDELTNGMVIDFKDLKNIVNRLVVDRCDHAFMYNKNSEDAAEHAVANELKSYNKKMIVVNFRPTAENMVHWIHSTLWRDGDLIPQKVRLYETPTSYAESTRKDELGVGMNAYTAE